MLHASQYSWMAMKTRESFADSFLWHIVLSTQLVIPHPVNGILNYTFILVVLVCLLLEGEMLFKTSRFTEEMELLYFQNTDT